MAPLTERAIAEILEAPALYCHRDFSGLQPCMKYLADADSRCRKANVSLSPAVMLRLDFHCCATHF